MKCIQHFGKALIIKRFSYMCARVVKWYVLIGLGGGGASEFVLYLHIRAVVILNGWTIMMMGQQIVR